MELALDRHFNKTKLRKGDEVIVTTGRSRGHRGKIEKIDNKTYRAFVSGANLFKKHQKPDAKNPDGGIVDKSVSIHLSNLMIVDPKSNKASRIALKVDANGKKSRVAKKSGTAL